MQSIQASSWDAKANKLVKMAINGEDDVIKLAGWSMEKPADESSALLGFELSSDNETWGTLAVAIAPFGWALIHTGEDHQTQHCTHDSKNHSEETVEVQWDEATSVPRKWFVSQNQALDGIRQWMSDGTLSPAVSWSDQCY